MCAWVAIAMIHGPAPDAKLDHVRDGLVATLGGNGDPTVAPRPRERS